MQVEKDKKVGYNLYHYFANTFGYLKEPVCLFSGLVYNGHICISDIDKKQLKCTILIFLSHISLRKHAD
jgi:hypothetical protein